MFRKKPKAKWFHPFGCESYALLPPYKQKPFRPKAERCAFLGFQPDYEAYRLLRLSDGKVIILNFVRFCDNSFPMKETKEHNKEEDVTVIYHTIFGRPTTNGGTDLQTNESTITDFSANTGEEKNVDNPAITGENTIANNSPFMTEKTPTIDPPQLFALSQNPKSSEPETSGDVKATSRKYKTAYPIR